MLCALVYKILKRVAETLVAIASIFLNFRLPRELIACVVMSHLEFIDGTFFASAAML
jgi:hypothetical protein